MPFLPYLRHAAARLRIAAIAVACAIAVSPAPGAEDYTVAPAFEPLPLGAIKPAGWLRQWCEQAAGGIAGHGDKLTPVLAEGWIGDAKTDVRNEVMQPGDRKEGYGLEQSAYWLDGAVRLAHLLDDKELLAKCRVRFEAILARVEAGQPPMNVNLDMWEKGEKWAHWPMAVMGRALLAEYSATGDPRYLRALETIYADYSKRDRDGKTFSLIDHNGRQIFNAETMFEAFRLGGDAQLRDEAVALLRAKNSEIERRLGWHESEIASGKMDPHFSRVQYGHAVTFNESAKVPAIGYLYTGDPSWLRFAEAGFEAMKKNEMLPYGLTSAHEQPDGIQPFALTELCNAVDYSWSNIWLLRIVGNGIYGDAVERAVFNAGAGGVAPDFKQHVYYLSPNRIDAKRPDRSPTGAGGSAHFAPTHQPLCCTANISRLLPNYVMHLWMKSSDGGLAATLYGPSVTKTTVQGVPVTLDTRTDYPFRNEVGILVSAATPRRFPLHLRAPEWSGPPTVKVNGETQEVSVKNGFVRIDRTWTNRDIVTIAFSPEPQIVTGRCRDGAPYASVVYGPLLFALQIPTKGRDLNAPAGNTESQFALAPNAPIEVVRNTMPSRWSWGATPPPLELKIAAQPMPARNDLTLAPEPVPAGRTKTISLVPFGATAFRVSMFSVADTPAQASR